MLRRLSLLLLLLPVSSLFAQGANVRVTIGDSTSGERYRIVRGSEFPRDSLAQPIIHGAGTARLELAGRDSGSVTILTDDPVRPVHVWVANGASMLRAVGAIVTVHVIGDSVSIEARDRSYLTPAVQRRP